MLHLFFCRHIASCEETWNTTSWTWERANQNKYSQICLHKVQWCYKLDGICLGAPVESPTASSSNAEHPTTNPFPELHGTQHTISWGRLAGSRDEWNTETQKPHDPIFMYRRGLSTSSWKIWVATIILLQIKTNGIWRMDTRTMANQEFRPRLPAHFLTIVRHVA